MQTENDRTCLIRDALTRALNPITLTIEDESQHHIGHAGAKGGGHFQVSIVSQAFENKTAVQRHRMVYDALGSLMQSDIHAIRIQATTPNENI